MKPLASAACAIVALLSGCTVGPNYQRPAYLPEEHWGEPLAIAPRELPVAGSFTPYSQASEQRVEIVQWWLTLHDPALDSLVERALAANLGIREAEARLRQARAQRTITAADLYPAVNAGGSYTRSRESANAAVQGNTLAGTDENLYQQGFDANWELDVFGGNRRNLEAASADLAAAGEDLRDVLVTLLAEIGRNYVDYRGAQQQISIAQTNVTAQQKTLDLTEKRFEGGLTSELDVQQARSQVAATEAQVPMLETRARVALHALGVLLAQPPSSLSQELAAETPIPTGPPSVPVGMPSELLLRRPDLRRAERQLAAATARIGVAVRDLYPRFFLVGAAGLESFQAADAFSWGSRYYSAGPSITWPVFAGGRIHGNIALATAREEELFASYQQVVLTALQEVEDALVAYANEQTRRRSLAESVAANERATELAKNLYSQGLADFLTVLDAQRSLYAQQDLLSQSDRAVTEDLIALYKALGGGWETALPESQTASAGQSPGS